MVYCIILSSKHLRVSQIQVRLVLQSVDDTCLCALGRTVVSHIDMHCKHVEDDLKASIAEHQHGYGIPCDIEPSFTG